MHDPNFRYKTHEEIIAGSQIAFINAQYQGNVALKPQLLYNNPSEGKKVLSSLKNKLENCEEFIITVAFITEGGLTPLLGTLKELEDKGVKGRILTTDYLTFTQPKALETLHSLNNIDLRMYRSTKSTDGFHTKAYIFKQEEFYRIIVGSSNLTQSAITVNKEWNTEIVSTAQGEYAQELLTEFEAMWDSENTKKYEDFFETYKTEYKIVQDQKKVAKQNNVIDFLKATLKPNKMQINFVETIQKLYNENQKRALLVSATATGKTYASAFAVRELAPKKFLFVVHREQIAKQAIKSYKRVMADDTNFGLFSGSEKDINAKYLFTTIQSISKETVLNQFKKDEFDVIVIDEVHRAGADSYQKLIDYFNPKFLLGMTASPERTDDYNIFELFNYNIALEIRLQQALEEDYLCPFHYFGLTDIEFIGDLDTQENELSTFNHLTSDTRVNYITEKITYYGFSGERVKGLIFCSTNKEAKELSKKFNEKGFSTTALSGTNSQKEREKAIERLTSNTIDDTLDYIFTVDIFNEGIDIPEINQVILLRPTKSPIVFVQQLGRGLRKNEQKEFVVILDFIGNYDNNFMIPIALSGDRTYNKDNIRRHVMEGERIIPGLSTIHFDKIARSKIFKSIDSAKFSDAKLIKEKYQNLKFKLGRIPTILDFEEHGEIEVQRIFENASFGSYYAFLVKNEPDYKIRLSNKEAKIIEFISKKIANGKRIHELVLLDILLSKPKNIFEEFDKIMFAKYGIQVNENTITNLINIFTNNFLTGSSKKTYQDYILIESYQNDYKIDTTFNNLLTNIDFKNMIKELVIFGKIQHNSYNLRYENTQFVLNQKYTYEDVCRLLEWEKNEVPLNIGGYKYDSKTKTYPVFINYHKEDNIQDTIKYEDRFLSPKNLIAISKQARTTMSEDVQNFIHAKERGIEVELFVRKNKDDSTSKEFYYLGKMTATGNTTNFTMQNTTKTAVEIEWILDTPVRDDIYEYITSA